MNLDNVSSITVPEGKVFSCFDSEDNLLYTGFHPEDYEVDDSNITFSVALMLGGLATLGYPFGLAITLSNGIDPSEGYLPVVFDRTINGVVQNNGILYKKKNMLFKFLATKPVSEHEIVIYMFAPNGKLLKHTLEETVVVEH